MTRSTRLVLGGSDRSSQRTLGGARTWLRAWTHTLAFLAAGVLLLATACEPPPREAPEVGVELFVSPSPARVGPSECTVLLTDGAGEPLAGALVELEGNMNHAGMVPVLAAASEVEPGQYRGILELTMGGDWFVLVRAELPDGRLLERAIDLPGVTPRGSPSEPSSDGASDQ